MNKDNHKNTARSAVVKVYQTTTMQHHALEKDGKRKQVFKVIWHKAASPFYRPSRRRIHLSAASDGQAHSPAVACEQCAMHSYVGTLQWAGRCPLKSAPSRWGSGSISIYGSLGSRESAPPPKKWHLHQFCSFCTAHPCAQHTDTQITLRATSVAIGRIYALPAGDVRKKLECWQLMCQFSTQ